MVEEFSNEELKILSRYCTNPKGNVFVLTNLPEVVKGTLFSRYSRSSKSLKRLLLDEFLSNVVQEDITNFDSINIWKAEDFYERVLVQYGDDSVAELSGVHVALEGISNLATKFIEDRRIGLSPLEKSSRYVYFNEKVNGEYKYYKDEFIMNSKYAEDYIEACNLLFDTYTELMTPMKKYYYEKLPKDDTITQRGYESTINAKVCDTLRGLLPASTLTNLGLFGNARAYEYLLTRMRTSNLSEIRSLGTNMYNELNKVLKVFFKRVYSEHGDQAVAYYNSIKYPNPESAGTGSESYVRLADYDKEGIDKVVASIIYVGSGATMEECITMAKRMEDKEKRDIILEYVGKRTNRRHRPGRAFENVYYLFDVCANFGAYRDLHRHRILTQERQLLTTFNGYDIPSQIMDAGYETEFREAMTKADEVFRKIYSLSPVHAQYVVPFAYRLRWYIRMNLREAYHLIELRSTRQGHPDYRKIAQAMYYEIKRVHPLLAEGMSFVDTKDYEFERLEAEKRIDKKLSRK